MKKKSSWLPLIILSAAQFLMILDSTVMNVSISQLVIELQTEVTKIQAAITAYALVMAAFMMTGGKIGDIIGRKKTLAIGLVIYGLGSGITAISQNIWVLFFGWSLLEGFGAALILPALVALLAENYEGKARALAYGVIGAASGLAIAAGPLIGGFFTTYLSWRYVFAGEVIIALIIVFSLRAIHSSQIMKKIKLDYIGALLSAVGLGLTVFGILQTSEWGFITHRNSPITPLGFSLVPFLILGGLFVLYLLYLWESSREKHNKPVLFKVSLFKKLSLRGSFLSVQFQYLVTAGVFFVLPLYLQIVLDFDALQTGITILPISVALIITSIAGTRLGNRFAPRIVVQIGMTLLLIGTIIMLSSLNYYIKGTGFIISLLFTGAGLGLINSQLGNIIQSSVSESDRSEAGGLQYTFQNVGTSLGTAIAGTILMVGLLNSFLTSISNNPDIPQNVQQEINNSLQSGVPFITADAASDSLKQAGVNEDQTTVIVNDYQASQLESLRLSLGILAVTALIGLVFTRHLPKKPIIDSN